MLISPLLQGFVLPKVWVVVMERIENLAASADSASRVAGSLQLLSEAYLYARDSESDPWDFAVEIDELRAKGTEVSELRWLVAKKYVAHGRELTEVGDDARSFRREKSLRFADRTCFVLTEHGHQYVGNELASTIESSREVAPRDFVLQGRLLTNRRDSSFPVWNSDRRELRLENILIKRFRWPAANQEMILATFHEDGWPGRIDDPLPPSGELDPKRRLHDTIKSLNRNHTCELIRFRGDGTGQGVIWELAEDA